MVRVLWYRGDDGYRLLDAGRVRLGHPALSWLMAETETPDIDLIARLGGDAVPRAVRLASVSMVAGAQE